MPTAITHATFGGPEVLDVTEVDLPEPGSGQVRLAVRAAGVNQLDWKILRGYMGGTVRGDQGVGVEVAGTVDAVGTGVDAFAVGDDVFGRPATGGYAEYALASVEDLVHKPADLPWEVAGGLTVVAETAYRVLKLLDVRAGETLLIHAAAGGVGTVASQLAVARGATVIGTASEPNHDYLRSLGVTPVTYGDGLRERVLAVTPSVDAVLDAAGKGALRESVELAGGTDRVVTIADPAAEELGVRFSGGPASSVPLPEVFDEVLPRYRSGELRLPIVATYPLDRAADALARNEDGHVNGKIVLLPS